MGVLFGRGGLAPFFGGYKNKVGVYLNDPPVWPKCPIFTNIFFFGRYELNEDTGTFFLFVGPFLDFSFLKARRGGGTAPQYYIHYSYEQIWYIISMYLATLLISLD